VLTNFERELQVNIFKSKCNQAAFFLLAISGLTLHAQQFKQPSQEELSMTSDPKAPGAVAVYLDYEETTDDPLHFHSVYARIKVLTEKGKALASVELDYTHDNYKVTDIKARTIHADGTIIPLEGKPEDLLMAKTSQFQVNRKVFSLPSVEAGSILEYTYKVRYDDHHFSSPRWEIQQPYFIHEAHYLFNPFPAFNDTKPHQAFNYLIDEHERPINSIIWWHILPKGVDVKTDQFGRFKIDLTDIPPAPNDEWMPPMESLLYKVDFYYMSATSGKKFWIDESKFWSKDVDRFADPDHTIHDAVTQLIAPTDSELDKAKKLYEAVQVLDNTDFTRTKGITELKQLGLHEARKASDTWKQKSGTSEDIALLYLAMLRSAGLGAYEMRVVNRDRSIFAFDYLSFRQFDDNLVILESGGKEYVLDPGEKMCPFQLTQWKHAGVGGVRQVDGGHEALWVTPNTTYATNVTNRTGDLTVDADGNATGMLRITLSGQRALHWRQQSLRNDEDELKKQFDYSLQSELPEGLDAHVSGFLGLDDENANLMVVVKVKGTLGSLTGKRLLLPGSFFESRSSHPFVSTDKREVPVDMHFAEQINDQITYHFPTTLHIEAMPQDAKTPWPGKALLTFKSEFDTESVTIARTLVRGFSLVQPQDYSALHDFYTKVATADQQQLVLTSVPAAK
jgi:hypothetical protein